jgi:hypothetical protein
MIMFAPDAISNMTKARQGFTVRITSQDATALLDGARITRYLFVTVAINGLEVTLLIAAIG